MTTSNGSWSTRYRHTLSGLLFVVSLCLSPVAWAAAHDQNEKSAEGALDQAHTELNADEQALLPSAATTEELSDSERELVGELRRLPLSVQESLLFGWQLNVRTLMIFAAMGRDKAYLFDPSNEKLKNFFTNNLTAMLERLKECPAADFAPHPFTTAPTPAAGR